MNAAYNKPATVSSRNTGSPAGCAAVDGLDGKGPWALTCFVTRYRDPLPKLTVDLVSVFTISQIDFTWPAASTYNLLLIIIIIIKHSLYSAIPHKNVWAQRALQKH